MDLLQLFSAKEEIGGLEITGECLSYLLFSFKDEKIFAARQGSVSLEAGTVENGELKNRENFAAALENLRKTIIFITVVTQNRVPLIILPMLLPWG